MILAALPDLSGTVLRPIHGHHAFEEAVARLAAAIRLGVYQRGSMLPPERELATRLNVSRATLREAMVALREAGLIQTKRGRNGGAVVVYEPHITSEGQPSDVRRMTAVWEDALEFRRVVEPGAAAMLARAELDATAEETLLTAHESVLGASTRSAHRQADSRFHLTIASLTGSERMIAAVADVQGKLHDMLSLIPVLTVNIDHSCAQHHAVVDAILQGRPKTARRVMEQHCDDTAALIRGLLA